MCFSSVSLKKHDVRDTGRNHPHSSPASTPTRDLEVDIHHSHAGLLLWHKLQGANCTNLNHTA